MSDDRLEVVIRDADKDDWAFIISTWRKSYRDAVGWVPAYIYTPHVLEHIEALRKRDAKFRIAADPDDSSFIWGFMCSENGVAHYAYVKESARHQGVARKLAADAGLTAPVPLTYWTRFAELINKKRAGSLTYEPSRRKAQ